MNMSVHRQFGPSRSIRSIGWLVGRRVASPIAFLWYSIIYHSDWLLIANKTAQMRNKIYQIEKKKKNARKRKETSTQSDR